ncbi:hypothetical protein B0H14DRAFT_3875919 [Mycena olivaceomarginata]|nr:hypothetical protein B0H14DRAFT_3875919 [Mycena olivaceomarginata]
MAGYAYYVFKASQHQNLYGYHAASVYISPFFPPVQSQLLTNLATPQPQVVQAPRTPSPHSPPSSGPTSSRGWTQSTRGRPACLSFFQSSFLGVWEWRGQQQQRILIERGNPEWYGHEQRGIRSAELCEPRAGGGALAQWGSVLRAYTLLCDLAVLVPGSAGKRGSGVVESGAGRDALWAHILRFWAHTCSSLPGRAGGALRERERGRCSTSAARVLQFVVIEPGWFRFGTHNT